MRGGPPVCFPSSCLKGSLVERASGCQEVGNLVNLLGSHQVWIPRSFQEKLCSPKTWGLHEGVEPLVNTCPTDLAQIVSSLSFPTSENGNAFPPGAKAIFNSFLTSTVHEHHPTALNITTFLHFYCYYLNSSHHHLLL